MLRTFKITPQGHRDGEENQENNTEAGPYQWTTHCGLIMMIILAAEL